ncbi:MAG: hypothetical protein Q4E57_03440 [Eubacteriales bacterium]|nr:hypothetical protein [Eubacteriales bacterium]
MKMTAVLTAVLASAFLSSCKGLELENKTEIVEEYTEPQAMILVANERNRYENIYSDKIWEVSLGDENTGFDKLTVQNVKQFMEELKLLCMLAEERGITATSQERDMIRQATDEYMNGLTEADIAYIGCDRTDVQKLYTDYFIADKLLKSITDKVDSEISDSEVKVIKIQQIGTTDLKKAKAILKRVKIDGVNFNSMASRYTETDTIDRIIMRTGSDDLLEKTAFALEEGQTSNILAIGDMFYIINCVDGYAEDETFARKERLKKALNNDTVMKELEPYRKEHNIIFVERFWNDLEFSGATGSTAENFFDIYNEVMGR